MEKFNREPNCKCCICGVKMWIKPSRIKRQTHGVSCSMECSNRARAIYMAGSGNHQYNLVGDKNCSYKSSTRMSSNGYMMERVLGHPKGNKVRDVRKAPFILKHRLIVEENYDKFSPELFEEIRGYLVLKDCYDVHHINENKCDNRIENLKILTRGEHTKIHTLTNTIIRDNKTGRIIGVIKQGELLGSPEADNQQPNYGSNSIVGSTTNSRLLPCNDEESNADTSSLPHTK